MQLSEVRMRVEPEYRIRLKRTITSKQIRCDKFFILWY